MTWISDRRYGTVLVTVSAVLWSTAGLFVRMADLDGWTVLGWRSFFSAAFLACLTLLRPQRTSWSAFTALGGAGLFSIVVSVISTISYIFALKLTTVANVMTIYATLPFLASGVALVWLTEAVARRVLIASGVSLLGIIIMAGATTSPRDIAGVAFAFVMTLGFATQLVHAKRYAALDMTLVSTLAAVLCAVLCWPFMAKVLPSPYQLGVLALFGTLTTGLAYVLVLVGGRYISSGEAGFLSLLDVILGPLWVWIFFAEQPAQRVLLGGAVVLAAVLYYLLMGMREPPASSPARS